MNFLDSNGRGRESLEHGERGEKRKGIRQGQRRPPRGPGSQDGKLRRRTRQAAPVRRGLRSPDEGGPGLGEFDDLPSEELQVGL